MLDFSNLNKIGFLEKSERIVFFSIIVIIFFLINLNIYNLWQLKTTINFHLGSEQTGLFLKFYIYVFLPQPNSMESYRPFRG